MKSASRCVIHCRVSTGKQAYEGESLQAQASICTDIAARNGWIVAHEPWLEAYSGRKNARPAFAEVLAFLDQNPGTVSYYLFRAIDRFTRGGVTAYERMKQELAKRGVELVDSMGVIQPMRNTLEYVGFEYDWSRVSPSEITEAVLATTAKAEATTILTRLIGQEISLTQKGYKIRQAVDGYLNQRVYVDGKKRVIQIADPDRAHFYTTMLTLRAEGQLTDAEIVDRMNAMGFLSRITKRWDASHQRIIGQRGGCPLSVKRFQEIVQRPIYCGVVWEKWTGWEPVKAAYDGLVSIETWNAANRGKRYLREAGGKLQMLHDFDPDQRGTLRAANNPLYPLRRVILCPTCRKPFLGSASRSRSGKHVPAYHCSRNHARVARGKNAFEQTVRGYLEQLRFKPLVVDAVIAAVYDRFDKQGEELEGVAARTAQAVADLEAEKAEAVRAFKTATSDVMRRALESDVERLDAKISASTVQKEEANLSKADLDDYLHELAEIMEHPAILLENPESMRAQRNRFDVAFEELPTLTEIENGTAKLSPILSVCEGEETTESALVRLRGLTWNQIRSEILDHEDEGDDRGRKST